MGLGKIHVVSCILLALGSTILTECAKRNLNEDTRDRFESTKKNEDLSSSRIDPEETTEEYDRSEDESSTVESTMNEELPILPPIILLDFDNDTIEGNSTAEEKSKRTVNGGLGYGFERNSFQPRKTNYYFPTGKTGTTVSIEESISPFLPRTIIEKYTANDKSSNQQARVTAQSDPGTTYRFSNLRYNPDSRSTFGHATKSQEATGYYETVDLNYRGSSQPVRQSSISTSGRSTVQGHRQNGFDPKTSSGYTYVDSNGQSYRSNDFATDLHGQRGNIFRPTEQTYGERGQNVFQPTIPTPRTDNSQILRENQSALRSTVPTYYGSKQANFDTVLTDPLNANFRSQSRNQATVYTEVHPSAYNDQSQSKGVQTTRSTLDPNASSYGYLRNVFNPGPNQQVYQGQGHNLGIASQDSTTSDGRSFARNQNDYQGYDSQTDRTATTANSLETGYEVIRNPGDLPRYTVENGVRYENKIFWKYPDGRISYEPPQTYVESYPEDSTVGPEISKVRENYRDNDRPTETSANGQGPVQFPIISESPLQRSPFVSSESLTSNLSHQQAYRIGYQSLVSQKSAAALARKAKIDSTASTTAAYLSTTPFPTSKKSTLSDAKRNRYRNYFSSLGTTTEKPVSRYMVGGPNPEYVDTTEPTEPLRTESGELRPQILARYTKRVQNYLKQIFTAKDGKKSEQSIKSSNGYENLRYSDLVNYNPSISRYIKDPSAILNVQPTFVQVGNSLVPVIILKVDGTAPVQPEATSNINLKALLQDYLVQYANSIKELARPTNYELGTEQFTQTQRTIETGNRLLQLARLNDEVPSSTSSFLSNSYPTRQDYKRDDFLTSEESPRVVKYGERTNVRPKTKSVQIIDRGYSSYSFKG